MDILYTPLGAYVPSYQTCEGGFDCEFVEKPPKAIQYECPVCLLILREPHQVNCCGYIFCRVCVTTVQNKGKPCPCCKAKKFSRFEDKSLNRSLSKFKVYCSNKEQGCKWVGELGQLDDHLNLYPSPQNQLQGCQLSQIKCFYCYRQVVRPDIEDHQKKQCPRRPFSCEYCKTFKSTYEKVTTNHWHVCRSRPMLCTNKCGETIQRQSLENHIANDCPLTIINCDFQHVGCEVRLPRKDMPAHLRDSIVSHLSLQALNCNEARKEITILREENRQLKQQLTQLSLDFERYIVRIPICPCNFTITNFQERKKAKQDWMSPPFYSHPNGYKICLEVCTNYWVMLAGATFISVYVHLMKGEFDDQLSWPFSRKVHITLLNQNEGENYSKFIDFTERRATQARYRVQSGERSRYRHGMYEFIRHDMLPPFLDRNNSLILSIETATS